MIVKQLDGVFGNSVNAWFDDLQRRHRSLMARYAKLTKQGHPSTYGYGVLIAINGRMIRKLEREYKKALADNAAEMTKEAEKTA